MRVKHRLTLASNSTVSSGFAKDSSAPISRPATRSNPSVRVPETKIMDSCSPNVSLSSRQTSWPLIPGISTRAVARGVLQRGPRPRSPSRRSGTPRAAADPPRTRETRGLRRSSGWGRSQSPRWSAGGKAASLCLLPHSKSNNKARYCAVRTEGSAYCLPVRASVLRRLVAPHPGAYLSRESAANSRRRPQARGRHRHAARGRLGDPARVRDPLDRTAP